MEDMKSCDITKKQKEIKAVAGDILKLLNGKNMKEIEMILWEVKSHCDASYTFTYKPRGVKNNDCRMSTRWNKRAV